MSETQTTTIVTDVAMLESLDPAGREVAVTSMLDQARQWLERAKESTTPARDVAEFKAFVATVAEAAKQKKLSEEIQLDAVEMVRRSERALGVAIREGQERGEIVKSGDIGGGGRGGEVAALSRMSFRNDLDRPGDFAPSNELSTGIYPMTDNVTDEQFEAGLSIAKDQGNLSRANVVRKVTEIASFKDQQADRWQRVAELAATGNTSSQIAREVGMSEDGLRASARKKGITFPADKLTNHKRIDPLYVIEQIVLGIEMTDVSMQLVDFQNVTPAQAVEWLQRLGTGMRAVRQLQTKLKEIQS